MQNERSVPNSSDMLTEHDDFTRSVSTDLPVLIIASRSEADSELQEAVAAEGIQCHWADKLSRAIDAVTGIPFRAVIARDSSMPLSALVLRLTSQLQPWAEQYILGEVDVPAPPHPGLNIVTPQTLVNALKQKSGEFKYEDDLRHAIEHPIARLDGAVEQILQAVRSGAPHTECLRILVDTVAEAFGETQVYSIVASDSEVLLRSRTRFRPDAEFDTHVERFLRTMAQAVSRGSPIPAYESVDDHVLLAMPVLLEEEQRGWIGVADFGPASSRRQIDQTRFIRHLASSWAFALRLQRSAMRDPLTQRLNRIGFEIALAEAWPRYVGDSNGLCIVVLDIDGFKIINDSYGHAAGDHVLSAFARFIETHTPPTATLARYGGDEFLVLMPETNETQAADWARNLLSALHNEVCSGTHYSIRITATIGIAWTGNRSQPASAESLLSQADRALYIAKRAGRNRICLWPHEPQPPISFPAGSFAGSASPATNQENNTNDTRGRILVVDDEPAVRRSVVMMLRREQYDVTECDSVDAAMEVLKSDSNGFDVLLTDISMPGKSGLTLLKLTADETGLVKIVMTGYATLDNALGAMREGAFDFITKPFGTQLLYAVIKRAVDYRRLRAERDRYVDRLELLVQERSTQLAESLETVRSSQEYTLHALAAMLNAHEPGTGQHSIRVHDMTLVLGREMGLSGTALETAAHGALLHDIGKIGIPSQTLASKESLSQQEWNDVRLHPETGYAILAKSSFLEDVANVVREHHERYDGTGYPQGLKANQICQGARVFAVADSYDAIRVHRPYASTRTPEEAAAEIVRNSGTQFDPQVVEAFKRCQDALEQILRRTAAAELDPTSGIARLLEQ